MNVEDVQKSLKVPAILLIVGGSLNGAFGLLSLLGGVFRLVMQNESLPVEEAERIGFVAGTVITYGIAFVSMIAAPVIIYGGVKMLSGTNYGMARMASILSLIPLTSCFCSPAIIVGIYVFFVLRREEVRAYFDGTLSGGQFMPPPPGAF
ncbi:MAG: hypothetical protein R2684_01630 [Pyrinomonadaceae bacterium]